MTARVVTPAHEYAYRAGWNASKRATADLDSCEARFCRKHPDPDAMFSAGWLDYAIDRPYGYTLRDVR